MTASEIFSLCGGIGLFLYGMTVMSTGLRNACGENLKGILEKAGKSRLVSVLVGVGITVLIQSSSATDVMVIGFVTSGMMSLAQALGVIMGANIGTTITAQITAFDIGVFAPFLLFAGAVVSLFVKNHKARDIGNVVLGFGMLFVGLTLMKRAIAPLSETEAFAAMMARLSNPILSVLFGVLFTALLQSSSSSTVIFQAFAVQGILSYQTAVYLVIGAAVGSVMPNILAGLTANREGRRCSILNLLFNLLRAVLILALITAFPQVLEWIRALSPGNVARQIANTHTAFAVISVAVLLPLSSYIVKLSERLLPVSEEEAKVQEQRRLVYLTQTSRIPPALAMEQARLEISRMGHIALNNLEQALDCFFTLNDAKRATVEVNEETVDLLARDIVDKLVELRMQDMSPRNLNRLYRMIRAVDDIERISDHAENIVEFEEILQSGRATISEEALGELHTMAVATIRSLTLCFWIFDNNDFDRLTEAKDLEETVDDIKDEITGNHIRRRMNETCSAKGGVIFTDMAVYLERCSDHALKIANALADNEVL